MQNAKPVLTFFANGEKSSSHSINCCFACILYALAA